MNSRKSKQNDENFCPIASKRTRATADSPKNNNLNHPTWIAAKLESTSSPTALINEYLEEMGVSLLDSSEESSSSASSAISFSAVLASVASNADENCNEATPNLNAPKFNHQQRLPNYHELNQTGDSSTDGNISFTESNVTLIGSNNNLCNNNFNIYTDETSQVPLSERRFQHKAVTTLMDSPNTLIAASSRKRSPLAIVSSNSQICGSSQNTQQQIQQSPSQSQECTQWQAVNTIATPFPIVGILMDNEKLKQNFKYSPSKPSTSHQAALVLQQQQLLQSQTQQQTQQQTKPKQKPRDEVLEQQIPMPPHSSSLDDFFLFRNRQLNRGSPGNNTDYFGMLSDEIILQIFQWLPKKALLRCGMVCRRFQQCATDESLWARLDLGGRSIRPMAIQNVLARGVVILRLAQANLREPVFCCRSYQLDCMESKLQYLDLSLAHIDKISLTTLLSYCRQLKKLSLEHVPLSNDVCSEIAENKNLEALNLAMCTGLEAWSIRKMLKPLHGLNSLNISWTNLSVDAVTALVSNVTTNLLRLNAAGCRKTMFDTHVDTLARRCPQLLELDLSDCTGLTANSITFLSTFRVLEYLSLSRCYLIPALAYADLKNAPSLAFIDIFGTLSDQAMELLQRSLAGIAINKFIHSSVARPTVGSRRTSIWGLRTRD